MNWFLYDGDLVIKESKVNQTIILYIYWKGEKKEQLIYLCSSLSNYKVQIGTLELIKNRILVKFEIKYSSWIKTDKPSQSQIEENSYWLLISELCLLVW